MNKKKKEWMKAVNARNKAERLARRERALGADSEPLLAPPVLPDALPDAEPALQQAQDQASAELAEARELVTESRAINAGGALDEARARAMLERAALLLDDVVSMTRAALAKRPSERRLEARLMLTAQPEPTDGDSRKRPRNGPDPVVTLMKIGMQAAGLLKRVIAVTHPGLGKVRKVA